jgi:hypothetical protein
MNAMGSAVGGEGDVLPFGPGGQLGLTDSVVERVGFGVPFPPTGERFERLEETGAQPCSSVRHTSGTDTAS